MANLTQLQKYRVAFHLDVWKPDNLLSIDRDITFSTMAEEDKLALVGPDNPPNPYIFEGQQLCSESSILGRIEAAHANLSPAVIDNSLLVKQAGKVTLRSDELRAREKLYKTLVESLAQIMGYTGAGQSRVGF